MNEMKNEYIFISCVEENSVKVIDANTGMQIESIKVADRPFDIKKSMENKLYVACDRSEQVEIIDLLSFKKDSINISNNGVMDIDEENSLMYISDGMNIILYNLKNKKIINTVNSGLGIEYIFVEKQGTKLFAIDSILNQLNIYNKNNLELIISINNLGLRPRSILALEEFDYVFIANEGIENEGRGSGITIVDLRNYEVKLLEFPKGSAITSLASRGNILYAVNRSLKRIEMINIITMQVFKSIEIDNKIPEMVEINSGNTKLYIVEEDDNDNELIEIIDLHNCKSRRTTIVGNKNIKSRCIISVFIEHDYSSKDFLCLSKTASYDLKPMSILVKRIFASYKQKMCVTDVTCEIKDGASEYSFENIIFKNAFIIEGSLKMDILKDNHENCRVKFTLRIPYSITLKENNMSTRCIEGFLDEKKDLVMRMPETQNVNDYEIIIKSKGELLNSPKVYKNIIKFSAGFFLLIRAIGEQEVQIPVYNCNSKLIECEEYIEPNEEEVFEAFLDFNNTPFPLNLFSISIEDND